MSAPDASTRTATAAPRLPAAPIAPPQNLEAEQSVLGAVLLSDTALPALIIDERLQPEDFYREAHGLIYEAMLDLHSGASRSTRSRSSSTSSRPGELEAGRRRARRSTRSPARSRRSATSASTRGSSARTRCCAACCTRRTRSRRRSTATRRPPRELVDMAERAILEVAHEDRRKDFRAIDDVLDAELDKLEQLSQRGQGDHRHAVGLRGPRRHHRRLPARQPDHPRRAPVDGQVGADGQLRRERGARRATRPVALFSLEMSEAELAQRFIASQASIKGDDLRKGRVPASRWGKILEASQPAREVAAVHRRLVRPRRCSTCARRRAGCTSSTPTGSG